MNPTRHKNYKSTTRVLGLVFCFVLFRSTDLYIAFCSLHRWRLPVSTHTLPDQLEKKKILNIYNCVTMDLLSAWFYFYTFCDVHCQQQIHKSLVQKKVTHDFLYFLSDFVPVYHMCLPAVRYVSENDALLVKPGFNSTRQNQEVSQRCQGWGHIVYST